MVRQLIGGISDSTDSTLGVWVENPAKTAHPGASVAIAQIEPTSDDEDLDDTHVDGHDIRIVPLDKIFR